MLYPQYSISDKKWRNRRSESTFRYYQEGELLLQRNTWDIVEKTAHSWTNPNPLGGRQSAGDVKRKLRKLKNGKLKRRKPTVARWNRIPRQDRSNEPIRQVLSRRQGLKKGPSPTKDNKTGELTISYKTALTEIPIVILAEGKVSKHQAGWTTQNHLHRRC